MNRRINSIILFWLAVIAAIALCFAWAVETCHGQAVDAQGFGWYKIKPIQGTVWPGVLGEVTARSRRIERQERDVGTICHETTHYLNSQIRNEAGRKTGQDAAYVPGGFAVVLPKTGIRMVDFAQSSRSLIGSFYWSDGTPVDALALIDEYSAYMCGMSARLDYPSSTNSLPSGDLKHGRMLETDIWRLRNVCKQRGYPYVNRIDELLAFGSAYFARLERGME